MAAVDYEIVKNDFFAFLSRKVKPTSDGRHVLSRDNRVITSDEIIGLFEFYLKRWAYDHPESDTVVFTDFNGVRVFEAKLYQK